MPVTSQRWWEDGWQRWQSCCEMPTLFSSCWSSGLTCLLLYLWLEVEMGSSWSNCDWFNYQPQRCTVSSRTFPRSSTTTRPHPRFAHFVHSFVHYRRFEGVVRGYYRRQECHSREYDIFVARKGGIYLYSWQEKGVTFVIGTVRQLFTYVDTSTIRSIVSDTCWGRRGWEGGRIVMLCKVATVVWSVLE